MNNADLVQYTRDVLHMPMAYVEYYKGAAEYGFVVTHHVDEAIGYLASRGLSDINLMGKADAVALDIAHYLHADERVLLVLFTWGFEEEASKFRLRFL